MFPLVFLAVCGHCASKLPWNYKMFCESSLFCELSNFWNVLAVVIKFFGFSDSRFFKSSDMVFGFSSNS